MASKNLNNKNERLFNYQEYMDTFCPKTSEEEMLVADDPRIVGINLAKLTISKIKHQLSTR